MTKISVAIAAYNRKQTTLACLARLKAQCAGRVELTTFLLDDASPDGTANAVREQFPDVHVIDGTGNLFWGGGMHAAMTAGRSIPHDFILWLNDDVELASGAVERLLDTYDEVSAKTRSDLNVIVGAFFDPNSNRVSYSAFKRMSKLHPAKLERVHPAKDAPRLCDTLNGNCVLIPKTVADKVGDIDTAFIQQLGDIDYGYRIVRNGASIWLPHFFSGTCISNTAPKRWLAHPRFSKSRWRVLMSPLGLPYRSWARFFEKYAGPLTWPLLLQMYVKQYAFATPTRTPGRE